MLENRSDIRRYALILLGIGIAMVLLVRCGVKMTVPSPKPLSALELPAMTGDKFRIVCEEGRYTLWYDTLYRQAAWAAHVLTRADVEADEAERKDYFSICEDVQARGWPYARHGDYTNTGYDRGHLVPSADRLGSQEENDATFRLSNIAPQTPHLNRVVWNALEQEIRELALRYDTLYVVTGGELKPGLPRIGEGRIGVPERFFKVILTRVGGGYRAVAWVIPNTEQIPGTFADYAVTVDEAEGVSGLDFFPALPDDVERRVEAQGWME